MKLFKIVLLMLISVVVSAVSSAQAQITDNMKDEQFKHPPAIYSRDTINQWISEAAQRLRPNLPIKIMSTAEWSNYINFHHFVPGGSDPHGGVKEDELYDFNWSEETFASKGLPTAEVTESGEFNFWWERCNYKKYDEKKCKWFIDLVVKHEGRHHDQWKDIALNTLNSFGKTLKNPDGTPRIPSSLKDLETTNGAVDKFMSVWADQAHYQCREVEVYSMQLLNGEFPDAFYAERIPYMMWYANRCRDSKWASTFAPHILRTEALFKWWTSVYPDTKVEE